MPDFIEEKTMRYFVVSYCYTYYYCDSCGNHLTTSTDDSIFSSETFPPRKLIIEEIHRNYYVKIKREFEENNVESDIVDYSIINIFEFKCEQDYLDFIGEGNCND